MFRYNVSLVFRVDRCMEGHMWTTNMTTNMTTDMTTHPYRGPGGTFGQGTTNLLL